MSSDALDPILEKLRQINWGSTPEEIRATFEKEIVPQYPHPAARVETLDVSGIASDLIAPSNAAIDCIVLYFHGGGFVFGSRKTHRRLVCDLAHAAGIKALVPDYRLAPEHPFPAAIEDALTAYRWLINDGGFESAHIAIAGDSAGGNLTLALVQKLREVGEPLPAAALLWSPWTDLQGTGETIKTKAETDPVFSGSGLGPILAPAYLPQGNFDDPLVSPIHADLTGFPPLLIHVGTREMLLDDSLRLARRAGLSDVPVSLKVWPNMFHTWQMFAPSLPQGQESIAESGAFLAKYLKGSYG